jgi:3-hydroxybutyryl-CoA dehydrogenase
MGPFQLMDLIGIDINYTAMLSMYEQTWGEPRYKPHWLQSRMIALNTLGRKSGRGFYNYNQTENPTALPELPRRGGNHSHVLLGFGAWEAGLVNYLTEAGYSVETKPEENTRVFVALLSASKTESLRNFVTHWDRILPTDIPLIVQACDITVSEIATWMENPERLVGFDSLFLAQGPIVTLVANPVTTDLIRLTTNRFMESLGNYPVWVADTPGLVLPRVISMIVNEAFFTIQDGVTDPATLDLAMQLGANYPLGPLEWAKKIGYSQILGVLDHLYAEFHEERYRAAPLLRRQMRESLILDNKIDGGKNGE